MNDLIVSDNGEDWIMLNLNSMKPCVDCNILIDADVWEEELGMCLNCSDRYWNHEGEENE